MILRLLTPLNEVKYREVSFGQFVQSSAEIIPEYALQTAFVRPLQGIVTLDGTSEMAIQVKRMR